MKKQELKNLRLSKKPIATLKQKKTSNELFGGANTFRVPCRLSIFHHCT
ncbi:MAG: hypothetical protein AB8B65_16820 [Kordia sp.]